MPDLADLFPGFASHWIDTRGTRIFARQGGSGPPLLLLHGYPETHVMWHRVAPALAERFTVVAMDLRGYGWSSVPDQAPEAYSKRAMALDAIDVMEKLGFAQFALAGHDRGGRVGYRLALDHPGRLSKLAVLDIIPTGEMWAGMDAKRALKVYHWMFLAQPAPLPERMIAADPKRYIDHTLASWTAAGDLSAFDERALLHYRTAFSDPTRIAACCADYRAGAGPDRAQDDADRAAGKTIGCPVLALWGDAGIPAEGTGPLDIWRRWAPKAEGVAVKAGHFLPEENPAATADALIAFFGKT